MPVITFMESLFLNGLWPHSTFWTGPRLYVQLVVICSELLTPGHSVYSEHGEDQPLAHLQDEIEDRGSFLLSPLSLLN